MFRPSSLSSMSRLLGIWTSLAVPAPLWSIQSMCLSSPQVRIRLADVDGCGRPAQSLPVPCGSMCTFVYPVAQCVPLCTRWLSVYLCVPHRYGFGSQTWMMWAAGSLAAMASISYPAISAFVSMHADADKQGKSLRLWGGWSVGRQSGLCLNIAE